jgi:hypothetical protein
MIGAVRNHQRLIPLAHDIIAEIASNQIIYSAIANSSQIDQSQFNPSRMREVPYVVMECELKKPYSISGENCTMTVSISNLSRDSISVVKIDEILPEEFQAVNCRYPISVENSLNLNFTLAEGTTREITLDYKSENSGSFVWHPSLVYIDASKNYRISRSQAVRSVIEQSGSGDFSILLTQKNKLEEELLELNLEREKTASNSNELSKIEDQLYTVKEKISKIDEEFLRTKNEYLSMQQELERIRSDIASLNQTNSETFRAHDSIELESEEKLLIQRIERRRSLLEQARLL